MWNPTQFYSKLPFFIIMRHTSCMQKVYCLIRTYQVSLLSSLHRNDSLKFQCDKILCSLWKCLLWFECYLMKFRVLSKRHTPSRCWLLTPYQIVGLIVYDLSNKDLLFVIFISGEFCMILVQDFICVWHWYCGTVVKPFIQAGVFFTSRILMFLCYVTF